ncbi:MAG: Urea transporter [Stenotrophomonas maltophilia]|nr:MAG: Urea transporter [Stenotrophomonas maltophilia]
MPVSTLLAHWLRGFSQIYLQRAPAFGLLLLILFALAAPTLLPGALLGALLGPALATLLPNTALDREDGLYAYNPILLGLLLSLHYAWTPAMAALLLRASRQRHGLPPYTLTFVLLGWLGLALGQALQLKAATPSSGLLAWLPSDFLLSASTRAFGQVVFLDAPLAGLLLVLGLLLNAPRATTWALLGAVLVLPLAVLAGLRSDLALDGLLGMNSALAALALALRSQSPWPPLAGALLAVAVQQCLINLGWPVLTAPFVFASYLVILGQRWLGSAPQRQSV